MEEKVNVDRAFGKKSELEVYQNLAEYWGHNIKRKKKMFSIYDYYSDKYIYELKTRRNTYEKFSTTMIAKDKIIEGCKKKQIFLFRFLVDNSDELYYIKYNEERFKQFRCEPFRRTDRGSVDHLKLYYFIPIEKLFKVEFD